MDLMKIFMVSGDVDCILRMLSNGASIVYIDKVIVDMATTY